MTAHEPQAGPETAREYVDKLLSTALEAEPGASDLGRFEPNPYDLGISDDPEVTWAEVRRTDPEAGLGHDYDGPELRSGTPEYEAEYAEYQAWAAQPDPEPEAEPDLLVFGPCDQPVPYTLTPEAEEELDAADAAEAELADEWDCADSNAYQARVEAELEPEAEL